MASRWRSWDLECLDSTLMSNPNYNEPEMILPVGKDRGFSKLSLSSIVLPKAALVSDDTANSSKSPQCGRGRSLKNRALTFDKPGRRPSEKDQVSGETRLGFKFLGSEYLYDQLFPGLGQSKGLNNPHQTASSSTTLTTNTRFSASKNSDQPNRPSQSSSNFAMIASQTKFPKPSSGPQSNNKASISKNLVQSTHPGNSSSGGSSWPSLPKTNHGSSKPFTKTSLSCTTIPSKTNFKEIHLKRKINPGKSSTISSQSSIRSIVEGEEKSTMSKKLSEKSAKSCQLHHTSTDCVLRNSTTSPENFDNVISVDPKKNNTNLSDNSKLYSDNNDIPAENDHNQKVAVHSSTDEKVKLSNTRCNLAQPLKIPTNNSATSNKCDDHNITMSHDNHWEFEPPVHSDRSEASIFSWQQIHTDSTPDNICHKATENYGEPSQPVLDATQNGKSVNSVSSSQPDGLKTSDLDQDKTSKVKTEVDNNANTSKEDQFHAKLNTHSDINPCENVLSVDQQESVQLPDNFSGTCTMSDCSNIAFAEITFGHTNDHKRGQPLPCLEISENAEVLNMDDQSVTGLVTDDCTKQCEKDEQSLLMSGNSDIIHNNSGASNIHQESNELLNSTSDNTNVSLGTDNIKPGNGVDKTTLDNSNQLVELSGLFNSEGSQPSSNINGQLNQLADNCAGNKSIKMSGDTSETEQMPQPVTEESALCHPITDRDNSARINDSVPSANYYLLPYQSNATTKTGSSYTVDYQEPSVTTNSNPETSDNKNLDQKDKLEECDEESSGEPCDVKLGNLPLSITEEDLLEIVEPYGTAISFTFREEGSSKTCIVRMPDAILGEWLAVSLDGLEIDGHRMQTTLDT